MPYNHRAVLSGLLMIVVSLLFTKCTNPAGHAGTATETENVAAMLYNPNGTPAAHATVRFYKYGVDPRTGLAKKAAATPVDSTTTNTNGNYTAALDTGTYNILASSNGNATFQDSITVVKDSTVNPPTDTLKTPGNLQGRIALQPGDDARTVFILFLGTNTFFEPADSIGNFTTLPMAKGKYQVRILTTLDAYTPKDTVLSVTAGVIDTLTGPIVLQYTGIPVPTGLKINYDTLKQIVTLTWNKPTTGRKVAGYNIYRMNVDSNTSFSPVNLHLVTGATYSDSTGVQDQTYQYRIAAVDTNGTEGVKSAAVSVKVAGAFVLTDTIGSPGSAVGQFTTIWDMTLDSSGNLYVVSCESNTGNSPRIQKFETASNKALLSIGTKGIDTAQFNQPKGVAVDANGLVYVTDRGNARVQIFDSLGNFLSYFKGGTADSSKLMDPKEVAVIQNAVYVADYSDSGYYSTVKKFDRTGKFIKKWGQKGDGQGQFRMIWAIKTTPSGEVITLDENGIQFFTNDGQYESGFSLKSYNTLPQDFYLADSLIYLTAINDNSTYEFLIVNMKGALISRYSLPAFGFQIAVREKTVFISDFSSGRILVYKR
jgi:hypothetical protein